MLGSSGPGKIAGTGPVENDRPSPVIMASGVRAKFTWTGTKPPSNRASMITSSAPVATS